ncbi:putative ubiquitin carboxyl-terminal hydrolase 37 isoform X2 [Apostichopus japonicus]|uniref:Putative ubiquitin carboxyl-terminal hydrolase 37 isoform X2 n=1 Tax=Stichopus japonicus TaxID=307972 RepID=A0A2G8JD65_STIJA|nr:putative ubiquitin carboxyl-terminal hydrolase 37 isoform X2 [Apostichopus japonicus]
MKKKAQRKYKKKRTQINVKLSGRKHCHIRAIRICGRLSKLRESSDSVKVSMGTQSDGEGASLEGAEAVEITEIESDSSITPDAAAEEKEESLKSGENLSNPAEANKDEDVFSLPDSNLSREQLRAQEDEELRKATELSLLEQKDVALREEEEIRKAQELSLQEYEKQSPPLMIQEAVDDSPDRPLYSKEEWKELKQNAKEGDMPNSYQLVCVVSHIGSSLTMGHYVSDVFNSKSESWLSYDDSNVSVISGIRSAKKGNERAIFSSMKKYEMRKGRDLD